MKLFAVIISFFTSLFGLSPANSTTISTQITPSPIESVSKITLISPTTFTSSPKPSTKPTTKPASNSAISTPVATSTTKPTQYPTSTVPPTSTIAPSSPTSTPVPQTSYTTASSCSTVTVTGATYAGNSYGKEIYYMASSGTVTLTANTTPSNGKVAWKIASYSNLLSNGGSFSANNRPSVTYTAPANTSGSDQGVEIRGDISESPNPWLYCPPFTLAIHSN